MSRVPDDNFDHYYDPYADLMLAKTQIRRAKTQIRSLQLERDEMFKAFDNMIERLRRLERNFDRNKH